jgi:hypothetical protein
MSEFHEREKYASLTVELATYDSLAEGVISLFYISSELGTGA